MPLLKTRLPIGQRGPLRVMFLLTSMPVGGAETLLVNLVRRMNPKKFLPYVCCLKEPGPLGEELSTEFQVFHHLIGGKYDVKVLGRLKRLLVEHEMDAVITVGAGDKMFWGRIAAKRARVPVIASALHSTGWPDGVGRLNRMLTPITDAFIAVAQEHGRFLVDEEGFPAEKVVVISNGIDTQRFQFDESARKQIRCELGVPVNAPVCGIVAALRPEKNHALFLRAAATVRNSLPNAHFLIAGDGPVRPELDLLVNELNLQTAVHFLGSRSDIPQILSALDLFALTSQNEASPVSILEAMSVGLPVVAPRIGSIPETLHDAVHGFLVETGDVEQTADRWLRVLSNLPLAKSLGERGREFVVDHRSLDSMVCGYEELIARIYSKKCNPRTASFFVPALFGQCETADRDC